MKFSVLSLWALALCFFTGLALHAADDAAPKLSADAKAQLAASLKWQTGAVTLKDGLAKINLTPDFRFIGSDDARKVLHDLWGNPDDPDLLGMIFPADKGPLDDDGWGVTVNYEESGYVKDDDASKINYDELLKQMQKETQDADAERVKAGYPSLALVGWAAPPHYDQATHKLYWAKELKVGDYQEHTLNYDIRILGRHGVLVLGAIADLQQFPDIQKKTPDLLSMVDFQAGNTYGEFDPKIDKVAEYGLATLIAGGALAGAAKLGLFAAFFKWIIAAGVAMYKVVIVAFVAGIAAVKKLWAKITNRSSTPSNLLPPQDRPPQ